VSGSVRERTWSIAVPHDPIGARTARHQLASELVDQVPAALLADAVAVVGELLGNAVRHARPLPGGVIRLSWLVGGANGNGAAGTYVIVRVTDGGGAGAIPRPRTVGPDSVDGRGLAIVAALAARWGVEPDGAGQCVWARVGASAS
jgi:anti-sigma regulatory factor (Ser/Thr protein kinase)